MLVLVAPLCPVYRVCGTSFLKGLLHLELQDAQVSGFQEAVTLKERPGLNQGGSREAEVSGRRWQALAQPGGGAWRAQDPSLDRL